MSKMGAKTYSRKTECRTLQLENFLAEKGNKPSTAKVSVSAIHRWGMTSYTSIRKTHLNGQKDTFTEAIEPIKRIKVEPKISRSELNDPFGFENENSTLHSDRVGNPGKEKSAISRPNKFFKSGARNKSAVAGTKSSKNDDFDALRLSVPNNWNNVKPVDSVTVSQPKKLTCFPIIEKPVALRSAILDEPATTKPSNSLTSYISSLSGSSNVLQEKSNEMCDIFADSMSEQTLLIDDYFSKSLLSIEKSCNKKLATENLGYSVKRRSVSPPDNVISSFTRTSTKNGNFNKSSKCDIVNDLNSRVSPVNIRTNNDKLSEDICDSSDNLTAVTESCSQNTKSVPSKNADSSSIPVNSQKSGPTQKKNYSLRKKIFNTSKKPKAVYNHRHWQSVKDNNNGDDQNEDSDNEKVPVEKSSSLSAEFEEVEMELSIPNSHTKEFESHLCENTNAIKCYRPMKELYTVVRNVKQAYQCHESGEAQEFNDDIEYLLEGLQICNGIRARCLSVLGLASKCMSPAFRIHLRAHGTMPKIFSALQDAASDPNLALCTATLLFVLSQDRLTMDIEASTLSLMLQLLESDPGTRSSEKELELMLEDPTLGAMQEKHREKVLQLCEQIQQKGHAKHLKLDNINTGILAMETLLSLTSRKAGEWFKEEIRILHGLDHIVDTISSCVELLLKEEAQVISSPSESQIDTICKIDRCLRVLENVTCLNHENQNYLLAYKSALVITCCLSLLKLCKAHLMENPEVDTDPAVEEETNTPSKRVSPVVDCLIEIMKVILNITYENPSGSSHVGARDGCVESILSCILHVPGALPREKRFDLLVLSLGLMINLVQHNALSRKQVMECLVNGSFDSINDGYEVLAPEALIEVLLSRLESARESEEQADELLSSQAVKRATDSKNAENAASNAECLEETLMKTLQKAGKHMEHSIIAAYVSIILGFIIENDEDHAMMLKELIPDGIIPEMVEVMKKFVSFVNLTGVSGGHTGVKSIQRLITLLDAS